jgi:hypothetical protein
MPPWRWRCRLLGPRHRGPREHLHGHVERSRHHAIRERGSGARPARGRRSSFGVRGHPGAHGTRPVRTAGRGCEGLSASIAQHLATQLSSVLLPALSVVRTRCTERNRADPDGAGCEGILIVSSVGCGVGRCVLPMLVATTGSRKREPGMGDHAPPRRWVLAIPLRVPTRGAARLL